MIFLKRVGGGAPYATPKAGGLLRPTRPPLFTPLLTVIKMRIRVGRTLGLLIALAFLILVIPLLMFKLESVDNQSISNRNEIDYPDVNIKIFIVSFLCYC